MHGKRTSITAAIGLAAALQVTAAYAGAVNREVGPNLVSNGGFENTAGVAGSGWTPSGFSAEGFDYFIDNLAGEAHSGSRSFAGGGIGVPGLISQNLATTPGRSYNIHFWLANLSGFSSDTEVDVYWGGNLVYTATDLLGSGYKEIVIDPLATSILTTLSFGLRDDSFLLNIDDISVREVPEPGSPALAGVALAGLLLARRRAA